MYIAAADRRLRLYSTLLSHYIFIQRRARKIATVKMKLWTKRAGCGVFSILKFPRVLLYSTPSIISRKKCSERKDGTSEQFLRCTGKQGRALRVADILILALPNLLLVFQISRHVEHVLCRRKYFLLKRRVIKQIVGYISSWTVCQRGETADTWISTASVFSIYYDMYVWCDVIDIAGSWRVFFPFRFYRHPLVVFQHWILALGRGLTANYL